MFYWRKEGKEIKQGFNIYPLKDPINIGFVIKLWKVLFRFRYSKRVNRFFCSLHICDCDGFYYR